MLTPGHHAGTVTSGIPYGKGWVFLMLAFLAVTLGEDKIFLEVRDFSHSQVELTCRCDCEGNMTDAIFEVYNDKYSCLTRDINSCTSSPQSNCDIECQEFEDPRILPFAVKLDGRCEEQILVRCKIDNFMIDSNMEKSIIVKAQSDPPVISINDGQEFEASFKEIEITCTVRNICYETKLEILGAVHLKELNITHKKEGSRFTTTATSTGIFQKPGNYTISCKEIGKDEQFSRSSTVTVDSSEKNADGYGHPKKWLIVSFASIALLLIFILSAFGVLLYRYNRKLKKEKLSSQSTAANRPNDTIPLLNGVNEAPADTVKVTYQQIRKKPEMLAQKSGICGIWIEENERSGNQIFNFVKEHLHIDVCRANIEDKLFLQEGPNFVKYFAVISSVSLRNKEFMAYLTSVVGRVYNVEKHFVVVLVLADEDIFSIAKDQLDKTLITDLQALPRVDAFPEIDSDCLQDIIYKLKGPSLSSNSSLGIGNVGIGQAWSLFYGHLSHILPGMWKQIEKSEYYRRYNERLSKYFIIIIPEFGKTKPKLCDVDSRISLLGNMDEDMKTSPWHPHRPRKTFVYQIKYSQEERYCFCGEYGFLVLFSLDKILKTGKLTEVEAKHQVSEFTSTLKSILKEFPSCEENSLVYVVQNVTTLTDDLRDIIKDGKPEEPMDSNRGFPVQGIAQSFAWSVYHNHLKIIGPEMAERIKASEYCKENRMPTILFILLPYSCYSYANLEDADNGNIKLVGKLKPLQRNFVGEKFDYDNNIYEISNGQKAYFACVEYCTRVQVLYEMEKGGKAGLTDLQKAAELRVFYEILCDMLCDPSAPWYCRNFKLVYYNDVADSGRKLSEILVEEIKESLQEECYEERCEV